MTDFAPPTGPPPPKVPEGWKAVWNEQYSEYFYVNIYTKKSQWEKPNEPVYPPGEAPPDGPPPYQAPPGSESEARSSMDKKTLSSNNPYVGAAGGTSPHPDISEDERLARRLQEEENARLGGDPNRGAADAYYGQGSSSQPGQYGGYGQQNPYPPNQSPYPQSQSPYAGASTQDKGKSKGGLLGKLLGKTSSSSHQQHGYPQQQGYAQPGYGAPSGGYYGQQGYYPQQQMYGRPPKKSGGLGAGGAAALGVGGGLLGGALIGEAMADAGDGGYGDDGGDYGGDGGDFGGGDFGGGGDF